MHHPSPHVAFRRLDAADRRRITVAADEPSVLLSDSEHHRSEIALAWLDVCDDQVLTEPWRATESATVAVELARRLADRHLLNLARGVLVHARGALHDFVEGGQLLAGYEDDALGCCPRCRSDWLRRMGDFVSEFHDGRRCQWYLESAEGELGDEVDDNLVGRIRFVRSIAHHFQGSRDRALADVGTTVDKLPLEAPPGYFFDSVAFLSVFVSPDDPSWDAAALDILERLGDRLESGRGWSFLRARMRHVSGQLLIRRRDGASVKAGVRRLEGAREQIRIHGLPREAVAIAVDLAMAYARRDHATSLRAARQSLRRCLTDRPDLPAPLQEGLVHTLRTFDNHPESAFQILADFRRSFMSPVRGLLAVLPRLELRTMMGGQRLPTAWPWPGRRRM